MVDFVVGKQLEKSNNKSTRKLLLMTSLTVNLGFLAFFKYFNFFSENLAVLFSSMGIELDYTTLNIILPVGISFYTFQTLSYTIDVYRGKLKTCHRFLDFALFVSFFPQLVAGPIERAKTLLPQISKARVLKLEQINAGIFLIVWGLFKKIVIADNVALISNEVFNNYEKYMGLDLFVGVLAFTIQIYCDFSAYSDIARGLAKMMGFELMINFKLPYFSVSPSDFWNRWHISLSSWLRDYLYIPLGGNRGSQFFTLRNLMITMLLGGLWHGASWNFILWGAFHGLILIAYRLFAPKVSSGLWRNNKERLNSVFQMSIMLLLTMFGWLLFRAESFEQISYFLQNGSFNTSSFTFTNLISIFSFSFPLLLMQIWQYRTSNLLILVNQSSLINFIFYLVIFSLMIMYGVRASQEFIYFQF